MKILELDPATAKCALCGGRNGLGAADCQWCRVALALAEASIRDAVLGTDLARAPVRLIRCDRARPDGPLVLAASAQAFAAEPETEADGSVWIELAYAVSMAGSEATLSKEDFERCIANFAKYPCCPVTIEHADVEWFPKNPSWAEPHGHVEELALGERTITEMDGTTRVAATLRGRVSFDDATRPLVGAKKKWRFGSIAMFKGVTDEATGAGLGAILWSWSLTAHPRLTGIAPIAASLRPEQLPAELVAAIRALPLPVTAPAAAPPAADPTTPAPAAPETPAMKFNLILASLGLAAAPTEEEAEKRVLAAAQFGVDALKAVDLPPTGSPAQFAGRVSELKTAAGKLPAAEAELATFRKAEGERQQAERAQWVDDLVEAKPELAPVKASLARHAETDWPGFCATYQRPSREDLVTAAAEREQRGQDKGRTELVTASAATRDAPRAEARPENVRGEIRDVLEAFGRASDALAVTEALSMGHTPATLRAALDAQG